MDIEALAKAGEQMPDGLTIAEKLLFLNVRNLTLRYRIGEISAEDAKKEIVVYRNEFKRNKVIEEHYRHCADLWLNISNAAIEFNKTRSIEAAEKMFEVIFRMKVSDKHD